MENKSIGALIGKVKHTCSTKNDAGDRVQTTITIDFTNCSDTELRSWLVSNRVIAGQRVWRTYTKEKIEKDVDGSTIDAQIIGRKDAKTPDEIVEHYMSNNPEKAIEMLKKLGIDIPTPSVSK